MICQCFPILFFHSFNSVFWYRNVLNLDKVQSSFFFFFCCFSSLPLLYTTHTSSHLIHVFKKWNLHEVKALVSQLWPALYDLMHYTVYGILHARTLEWVAIPFSRGSSQTRDGTQVSCNAGRFFTVWATRESSWTSPQSKWDLILKSWKYRSTIPHFWW